MFCEELRWRIARVRQFPLLDLSTLNSSAEPEAVDDAGVILKIVKAQISPGLLNGSLRKLPCCGSFESARLRRGCGG
jgi:hypothetical protein